MKHQTRIILAGMMGNLIESFDLSICGLLSLYLAKYLIGDVSRNLFIVFLTFFAGYLARPIGAIFLGLLSDFYGRKITLAASILMMGIATTLIGAIPPFAFIGTSSVIVLLILRIIQSFSCGAEYLNSSAYLIENAETSQKGFSGSWAPFGAMMGSLIASIVMLTITCVMNIFPELEWLIWRIPFVLALLGSSIGLYIRLCVPESCEYVMYYAEHPKLKFTDLFTQSFHYIRNNKIKSYYVFALSSLGVTTTFLIDIYGLIQNHVYGYFSNYQILLSNIISLTVLLCIFPVMGKLSDRINREKVVVFASIGFLILFEPYFYFLSSNNYYGLILTQSLLSIPAAAYYAIVPVILAEMFPLKLRCTVLSVLYSTAAGLSVGLTPLFSLILINKTQEVTSPTLLVIVLVAFAFTMTWLKNTQNRKEKVFIGGV